MKSKQLTKSEGQLDLNLTKHFDYIFNSVGVDIETYDIYANKERTKINEKTNIKSLEVDLNGTIWAIIGTEILKSTDNFKSFEQVTKGFPSDAWIRSVNSLVIDKSVTHPIK